MKELSLNVLDIAENSAKARAKLIEILITEKENVLTLVIRDDGCGMDAKKLAAVMRGERGGLGLSIVRRLTERNGGTFRMESSPGEGTVRQTRWLVDPYRAV